MTDIDESDAGFTLTGGVMRVHALGSESGDAAVVDDPDVALRALGAFDTAIGAAARRTVVQPVPVRAARLLRNAATLSERGHMDDETGT